jgi:hypothetical protein
MYDEGICSAKVHGNFLRQEVKQAHIYSESEIIFGKRAKVGKIDGLLEKSNDCPENMLFII